MSILNRFRSSLTYPIAATLVLVTVVPVALVGMVLANYNLENLTNREWLYLNRQAVSLGSEASLFLDGHRTQIESTARALAAGRKIDVETSGELLRGMTEEPGRSFVYLQILDKKGLGTYVRTESFDSEEGKAIEQLLAEAHGQAIEGRPLTLKSVRLPAQHTGVIFAYPLRDRRDNVWGTIQGVLDFRPLEDRIQDNSFSGLYISLIDREGHVVVASEPTMRNADLSASPLIRDFVQNTQRLTKTYEHPVLSDAGEVLGSVAPIGSTGWGVTVERQTSEAFKPIRVMQHRTAMISAAAAVVALAIGGFLSRRLTRPLQNLAEVSSEIAEGNFAVRAGVEGHDEIAQLATNFNHMASNIEALVRRLRHALRQNQELFLETIKTLAAAIDAKDPYTRGHSERVSSYSLAIARQLDLTQDEVFRVRIAAILHDVGKLGIKDGILNKPGGLTDEEFAVMRRHPEIGAQIMAPIRMLKDLIPGIRNHHETWDGKGYPDRLKGEEIPLVARIIGIADTFDAMTTTRPYQKAMTLEYVISRMKQMSGTRFDPRVIEAFLKAVEAGDMTPPPQQTPQEVS